MGVAIVIFYPASHRWHPTVEMYAPPHPLVSSMLFHGIQPETQACQQHLFVSRFPLAAPRFFSWAGSTLQPQSESFTAPFNMSGSSGTEIRLLGATMRQFADTRHRLKKRVTRQGLQLTTSPPHISSSSVLSKTNKSM